MNTEVTEGKAPNSIMTSTGCSKFNLVSEFEPKNKIRDRLGTSYQGLGNRIIKLRNLTTRAKTPIIFPVTDGINTSIEQTQVEESQFTVD